MPTAIPQHSQLYRNSYHSIAGVDIKAVFFGKSFGNLQAISYSITREKAPIYTCGSPEPRGFARGKRGIAGSLVMVMFDDHALLRAIEEATTAKTKEADVYKFVSHNDLLKPTLISQTEQLENRAPGVGGAGTTGGGNPLGAVGDAFSNGWNKLTGSSSTPGQAIDSNNPATANAQGTTSGTIEGEWSKITPWYSDQIPAFNIVLTGVNEEGYGATMAILGVEILNEGYGISIDDLISEQQMTYVCRAVSRWSKLRSNDLIIPSSVTK